MRGVDFAVPLARIYGTRKKNGENHRPMRPCQWQLKQPFNAISRIVGGAAYVMPTPFLFFLVNDALGFLSIGQYTLGLVGAPVVGVPGTTEINMVTLEQAAEYVRQQRTA